MEKTTKPKVSILIHIISLFVFASIMSMFLISAMASHSFMDATADQATAVAEVTAVAVTTNIGSYENLLRLDEDEEFRAYINKQFKYICEESGARYLYLYNVLEDDSRRYIVCVATDDKENEKINSLYGYGGIDTTPLHQTEINVLSEKRETDFEFIDNSDGQVYRYILPFKDEEGKIVALIGLGYDFSSIANAAYENRKLLTIQIIIVMALAFLIAVFLIKYMVVVPIDLLSKRMQIFAQNKTLLQPEKKPISLFRDEIEDIETSFESMTKDISQYIKDMEALTIEKVQSQTQLEVTRKIQEGIVPIQYTLIGDNADISGIENPAKEVGGDFYDLFQLDDHRICFTVGDVSGKGISAALIMIMAKTALREKIKVGNSLKATLEDLNSDLCASNPENMFATIFCGIFDTRTGVLRYANAGHTPPILITEKPCIMKVNTGTLIGLFDDITIEEEEIQLQKGEGIFVYTDGVTEAINYDRKQYGEERLIEAIGNYLRSHKDSSSTRELNSQIVDSVHAYSKGLTQFDDITCVSLLSKGAEANIKTNSMAMDSFQLVKQSILGSLGVNEQSKRVLLACEEIFINIVSYSGADNVHFTISIKDSTLTVIFSDNGVAFNPVTASLAEKDFEDLDKGGMGIKLARLNSDEMIYNRIKGRNELTLRFYHI